MEGWLRDGGVAEGRGVAEGGGVAEGWRCGLQQWKLVNVHLGQLLLSSLWVGRVCRPGGLLRAARLDVRVFLSVHRAVLLPLLLLGRLHFRFGFGDHGVAGGEELLERDGGGGGGEGTVGSEKKEGF